VRGVRSDQRHDRKSDDRDLEDQVHQKADLHGRIIGGRTTAHKRIRQEVIARHPSPMVENSVHPTLPLRFESGFS
jgi:hypothetical protein